MRDSSRSPAQSHDSLQTDAHYRLLVESVQDYAIFLLNAQGNVATWNDGARKIKGYDAQDIVGRHFSVFYPLEDIARGKPQWELDVAAQTGRVEDEGWRIRKDSTRFWANVVITALRDKHGALIGYAKVTRDMTDRVRLTELQHARELSAHVQAALENERGSIARELHDDLGQQLAALKMQLARLAPGDGEFAKQEHALQTQIDTIIKSIRQIAAGLRPPVLDELGLFAAIEWLVNDVSRRFGIAIHLDMEGEEDGFQIAASTSIFRIVQEALTNVVRHADASEVRVRVMCDERFFRLSIDDDGRGAQLDAAPAGHAFGLRGMGERVRQLGGVIRIDSAPGEGFRIDVEIPRAAIIEADVRQRLR